MGQRRLPWWLSGKESACNAGELGWIPGLGNPLKKDMATHCSILTREMPWTEEPGELQSMGSQRVGQDSATKQKSWGRQEEWKPVCGRKFITSPVINYSGFQVSHLWLDSWCPAWFFCLGDLRCPLFKVANISYHLLSEQELPHRLI